jgi:hypothetical protein
MQLDVAIVGAGTAGAGVAWQCAKRGMRVICLDARPLDESGARWVNGVPLWQLDEAGIPRPTGAELIADDPPFHLVAGWGPERVTLSGRGVVELDMRELVARLQTLARDAGAELRGGVRVLGLVGDRLETSDGPLRADVIIDASGHAGARLVPRPVVARCSIVSSPSTRGSARLDSAGPERSQFAAPSIASFTVVSRCWAMQPAKCSRPTAAGSASV